MNKIDLDTVLKRCEASQQELHKFIEDIKSNISNKPLSKQNMDLSYDTIKDVWFMLKIAELREEVEKLKRINTSLN